MNVLINSPEAQIERGGPTEYIWKETMPYCPSSVLAFEVDDVTRAPATVQKVPEPQEGSVKQQAGATSRSAEGLPQNNGSPSVLDKTVPSKDCTMEAKPSGTEGLESAERIRSPAAEEGHHSLAGSETKSEKVEDARPCPEPRPVRVEHRPSDHTTETHRGGACDVNPTEPKTAGSRLRKPEKAKEGKTGNSQSRSGPRERTDVGGVRKLAPNGRRVAAELKSTKESVTGSCSAQQGVREGQSRGKRPTPLPRVASLAVFRRTVGSETGNQERLPPKLEGRVGGPSSTTFRTAAGHPGKQTAPLLRSAPLTSGGSGRSDFRKFCGHTSSRPASSTGASVPVSGGAGDGTVSGALPPVRQNQPLPVGSVLKKAGGPLRSALAPTRTGTGSGTGAAARLNAPSAQQVKNKTPVGGQQSRVRAATTSSSLKQRPPAGSAGAPPGIRPRKFASATTPPQKAPAN